MLSGQEIQAALGKFVTRWAGYRGSERAEAQTFLNQLFAAYGADRVEAGASFEHFTASAGFMDLFLPGVLIVEMKAPGVPLSKAAEQRDRYWRESADDAEGVPAARWVVLCNFETFEVWEPGRFPKTPRVTFPLTELPDRYDALLFLQSDSLEPVFAEHRRTLTTDAARRMAELYTSMADRAAAPLDELQRFTMQLVWCLFAEDLGLLDGYPLQATVTELLSQHDPDSARDIGYLFRLLNQKGDQNRKGRYAGTRYVNGDLFARPAEVLMTKPELRMLRDAAEFDWRAVDPTIFGSLLEGVLGDERRERLGAHYTHEADIMKIVVPTIVRPWRERIEATETSAEARVLLDELCLFQVLDPACGCGNFLYIAYRELRGLEWELKQRVDELAKRAGLPRPIGLPYFPLANLHGIDIERYATLVARVTLWMGHRQMIDRYGEAEPVLPLTDLSHIRTGDALRMDWPQVEAIVGNPPFLGSQLIRRNLGDAYVDWLESAFGVGVKDLCVYWFRRAQDHLQPGQRAGLVGTNSISQNRARSASLDYVVAQGGVITDAVSSQKWPGDAKVHVSIVNWVKDPKIGPASFELDGAGVGGITAWLRPSSGNLSRPEQLSANLRRVFQGPIPGNKGFVLAAPLAEDLLLREPAAEAVVRPYLITDDVTDSPQQRATRFIIDFGPVALESAARYPRALARIRDLVKPERDVNPRKVRRERWWTFVENAVGMRRAIEPLERYIAGSATGKRLSFAWEPASVCPSNAINVFAFDDDYAMGILLSKAHDAWAWAQSSTLETRLRYTPTSVFETFPWPDPVTAEQRDAVSAASRALYARRSELCVEHDMGLTKLYNLMDDGAFTDLAALHRNLDRAVATAYGWPTSIAQEPDELVRRLSERNREIADGEREYDPFAHAGAAAVASAPELRPDRAARSRSGRAPLDGPAEPPGLGALSP